MTNGKESGRLEGGGKEAGGMRDELEREREGYNQRVACVAGGIVRARKGLE